MFRMIANGTFVMLGRGEVHYHTVYIDDLIQGLRLLAHHPAALGEVFHSRGQRYYALKKTAELVAEYLDVPPPRLHLPAWPLQMAGTLCEKICVPLGIEPPIYRRRVDFFTKSRAFSNKKARRMLGYQPMISLEAGLRLTLDRSVRSGHITRGSPIATFA
jgi:nucleoside-diphosphate-sugar epimerase